MSQYISSYLIEPVVRQARRFSRPETPESGGPSVGFRSFSESPVYVEVVDERSNGEVREVSPSTHGTEGPVRLGRRTSGAAQGDPQRTPTHYRNDSRGTAERADAVRFGRSGSAREQFVSANASFPSSINEAGSRYMEETSGSGRSSVAEDGPSRQNPGMVGELPEDDGMGSIRKKILEIQEQDLANAEKSRLVHAVMMEQYMQSPRASKLRTQSPSSLVSHERPYTPVSGQSNDVVSTGSPNTVLSSDDCLYTTEDERQPTYYVASSQNKQAGEVKGDADRQFGCVHYKRNVKLQCSACHRWYTCRFCHDQEEDHCLNRRATKNMLCMACGSAQPASQVCRTCDRLAAWYFCKICKLWDDDASKSIYHCDGCGICRRGKGLGKDFFHCKVGLRSRHLVSRADRPDLLRLHCHAD